MLRRFFIWRAEKRMGRSHYRLDKRQYQGVFKPGFFAHLNSSQFWQTDNDPYQRSRRRRRKVYVVVGIVTFIALVWVIIESSRALRLF
jgi:outer membrane scaffolding protein for murein synthesis (MipA/OmpV family)